MIFSNSHFIAPALIEAGIFSQTMEVADLASTVEIWFWSLPSNRFTDCPELLYSQKKASLTLLKEVRSGSSTLQETTDAIITNIINKRVTDMDEELASFAR